MKATATRWPVIHYSRLNVECVRELREARGMTHEDVARRMTQLDIEDGDQPESVKDYARRVRSWERDLSERPVHVAGLTVKWAEAGAEHRYSSMRYFLGQMHAVDMLSRVFDVPAESLVITAKYTVQEDRGF